MQKQSEEIKNLYEAFAKAQGEFTPVPKNKTAKVLSKRTNSEFSYKYADLADILAMALPVLSKYGIGFSQPNLLVDGQLRVCTKLKHASGEWEMSDGIAISESVPPQDFGAASSYYRRYDACSMLGIAPDEDTDAQHTEAPPPIRQPERRQEQDSAGQKVLEEREQLSAKIRAVSLSNADKVAIAKTMFPGHRSLETLTVTDLRAYLVTLEAGVARQAQPKQEPVQNLDSNPIIGEMADDIDALFRSGTVKRASELPKRSYAGKAVGKTLGQKLHIILNKAQLHTEEELRAAFLTPLNIEHFSDIPEDMYQRICDWAEGRASS